jgi:hypothetical protein
VRDAAGDCRAVILENGREVLVRAALMEEHGLARRCRHFQLCDERDPLRGARRKIPEIIQTAFPDGDHLRLTIEFEPIVALRRIEGRRMMRMHSRGAP